MHKRGGFSKNQIEILKLLLDNFDKKQPTRWTDFKSYYLSESVLSEELNELSEFFIKKEIINKRNKQEKIKRKHTYYLKPEKKKEVLDVINYYFKYDVKPYYESFSQFVLPIVFLFIIISFLFIIGYYFTIPPQDIIPHCVNETIENITNKTICNDYINLNMNKTSQKKLSEIN